MLTFWAISGPRYGNRCTGLFPCCHKTIRNCSFRLRASSISSECELEATQREPGRVLGEAGAFVEDESGEIAGGDDVHVGRLLTELGDHPGHDSLDLTGHTENHSRLQGLDRVLRNHRAGSLQFHLAQLGAATAERFERDLDSWRDRPADVLALGVDDVE